MRILIIGGTRFIGLATTKALHEAGHTIAVFNRGKNAEAVPEGIQHIEGDRDKLLDAADALRAFKPDVVWHNIVLDDQHVRDVQEVFTGVAKRFVMTSSMDVYLAFGRLLGKEQVEPITYEADEDSPVRSVLYLYPDIPGAYRNSKYDKIPAEKLALASTELPATVVRLPMVIGANDGQRRLLPFVLPMKAGRDKIVLDEIHAGWKSTYGYVDNMARALQMTIESDAASGRIYNAADGVFTWLEIGQMVKDAMGWSGTFVTAKGEKLPEGLRFDMTPQDLAVRAERIRADLGYEPMIDFEEGLRRTVAWDLEHLPDPVPPQAYDPALQDEALAGLSS
jgi:nucleoside-diphosphate-sugar epimerase